jgi:hypothetical protein
MVVSVFPARMVGDSGTLGQNLDRRHLRRSHHLKIIKTLNIFIEQCGTP